MNAPTRVVGFLVAVAVAFVLAYAVGTQVGPVGEPAEATGHADGGHSADEGHSPARATRREVMPRAAKRRLPSPAD